MLLEHVLRFANGLDHDGQSSVSNLGLLHFRPPLEDQAHNSANGTRKCRDSGSPRPTLACSVELCYGIRAHIGRDWLHVLADNGRGRCDDASGASLRAAFLRML